MFSAFRKGGGGKTAGVIDTSAIRKPNEIGCQVIYRRYRSNVSVCNVDTFKLPDEGSRWKGQCQEQRLSKLIAEVLQVAVGAVLRLYNFFSVADHFFTHRQSLIERNAQKLNPIC